MPFASTYQINARNQEKITMNNIAREKLFAVIMAGGKGERLWPLRTEARPKPLISLNGRQTLLEDTVQRLFPLLNAENVLVITDENSAVLAREILPIPPENIIAEPCRRNTAGTLAIACALVKRRGGDDAVGCVLPADHLIKPAAKFRKTLKEAVAAASRSDAIVTLGIVPDRPASEYGYIECDTKAKTKYGSSTEAVLRFVEKPDRKTAEKYLKTGRYLWNAGMFIWRAKTLETAFAAAAPDIESIINPLAKAKNPRTALRKLYPGIKSISFDYAVMEKIRNILVTKCSFDWDDVGSWLSFSEHFDADGRGNRRIGRTAVYETSNSTVVSDGSHLVAVAGLRDVVVVRTKDATLVMSADMADKMKALCDSFMPADGK
jgi:mannose-1-phosphate guanylyltransferase